MHHLSCWNRFNGIKCHSYRTINISQAFMMGQVLSWHRYALSVKIAHGFLKHSPAPSSQKKTQLHKPVNKAIKSLPTVPQIADCIFHRGNRRSRKSVEQHHIDFQQNRFSGATKDHKPMPVLPFSQALTNSRKLMRVFCCICVSQGPFNSILLAKCKSSFT